MDSPTMFSLIYNEGMTKVHAKIIAIKMREKGHSYNYIAPRVGVSKSTVGMWVAHIPYHPNAETIERIGRARAASGEAKNKIKRESIALAKKEALEELGEVSLRDLFMLGLGLYIGEGSKSTNMVRFANSNPAIIKTIIRWFMKVFGVSAKHIRLRVHIYPDCNEKESQRFWARITGIPVSQFLKTSIDHRTNKKTKKKGKLPYGTAHLIVKSLGERRFGVFLLRKIQAWSDEVMGVEKNAGVV